MIAYIGSHFPLLAIAAGACFAVPLIYVSIEEALSTRDS